MNTVANDPSIPRADGDYYLTPKKAKDKRRIAAIKARNQAQARVFRVDGVCMTVRQISEEVNTSQGTVSKVIKKLRRCGITRFTLSDFKSTAANDDVFVEAEVQ